VDLADAIRNAHDGWGLGERGIMADGGGGEGQEGGLTTPPPAGWLAAKQRQT
jgi:hypothetical protein